MNVSEHLVPEKIFSAVSTAAYSLHVPAYVVGGFVRDVLLKRPCKDIDFVCVGNGIALAEEVAKILQVNQVQIFKNFGTAQLVWGEYILEFVGARKESYRGESRNPDVEPGTLEDDQNRRDFTINAMAISLNSDNFGSLIDPFDGIGDLKKKIIKTPLDAQITFSDDPLRMLRACRFASQLHFDIGPDTFDGIRNNIERLKIISQERITDELNKIILSPVPSYGFKMLFYSGILAKIFPEMVKLHGVSKIDKHAHKDNFFHTLQVLDNLSQDTSSLWLRWAAILHDIAKPATQQYDPKHGWTFHGHEELGARWVPKIFNRMRLPLDQPMRYVQKLVRLHLRPIALVKETVTDSAIRRLLFETGDDIDDLMLLCKADITSKNMEKIKRYKQNFELVQQKIKDVEARDHIRNFQPPISGEAIMRLFGLKPSKEVGILKDAVKEAILEGKIENNYDQAYQVVLETASKLKLKPIISSSPT